jgi:hypothetical protein
MHRNIGNAYAQRLLPNTTACVWCTLKLRLLVLVPESKLHNNCYAQQHTHLRKLTCCCVEGGAPEQKLSQMTYLVMDAHCC